MPTSFIDVFKGRERKGTRNKKKGKEEREVNKKHKSNLTDMPLTSRLWLPSCCQIVMRWHSDSFVVQGFHSVEVSTTLIKFSKSEIFLN